MGKVKRKAVPLLLIATVANDVAHLSRFMLVVLQSGSSYPLHAIKGAKIMFG